MELWDVYDADRRLTGRTMVRGDQFRAGEYHLVVHICIFNEAGQMLIQRRQPWKDGFPNRWDVSVGGSAVAGDTSRQAAEREVLEEIGLEIRLGDMIPQFTINFPDGFDDFYLLRLEVDLNSLTLQESEVAEVRWAAKEEVMEMIDNETFVPYRKTVMELIFERLENGSHQYTYERPRKCE